MGLDSDMNFMREALLIATEDGADPALSPIGCVIVLDGKIIARERNHVTEHHDALAHAEIEAIRAAGRAFANGEIRGATLYTTLQPCGMCTMASIWSKVRRIVYGAGRENVHKCTLKRGTSIRWTSSPMPTGTTLSLKEGCYGTNAAGSTTVPGTTFR